MLKSAAYIRASAEGVGRSCEILRASLPVSLPASPTGTASRAGSTSSG